MPVSKEQREDLVQTYFKHGRSAIIPRCRELMISPQTIANYASYQGLYRRKTRTTNSPRWARARAIGPILA
jgi:hypothetical protein